MKNFVFTFLFAFILSWAANANNDPGGIAFVGFNADGSDNFAFVVLQQIQAGTIIYFTDNEWNGMAIGSGGAFADLNEGELTWTATSVVPVGTIVSFASLSMGTTTVSTGTVAGSGVDFAAANEVLYGYLGTSVSAPTVFLAAIGNDGFGANGTIANTGLTVGVTATSITGDEDVMIFNGPLDCTGLSFTDCATIINAGTIDNTSPFASGTWTTFDTGADNSGSYIIISSATIPTTYGILPIELLSFTAKPLPTSIRLDWATASEQNNDYMAVEKSADGLRWEELGRVAGAGTTTLPQSYTLTDDKPLPNLNYYRLRQVDFDGRFEYHKTIVVDFKGGPAGGLHLFPSPAKEQLNVALPSAATQDCELWLLDAQGRVLQRRIIPQGGTQAVFEVAALPEGVYFVRMAEGEVQSFRFVR